MANGWFQRKWGAASKRTLEAKVEAMPDGLWTQCAGCRELLTEDELMSQLRENGVSDISQVKEAYIEGDGRISVVQREPGRASSRPPSPPV